MPLRDWTFRISDILKSIAIINQYTASMGMAEFIADRKTVDAVIRHLTIIGEAACHIPDEICIANPAIPWKDMRAMRNFVVHEYFCISDSILWDTLQIDLPPLVPLLNALIKNRN